MSNSVFGLRLGDSEHEFLENAAVNTDGILSKAGVVRVLIRQAMDSGWEPLTSQNSVPTVPAYCVGAGNTYPVHQKPPLQFPPDLEVTSSIPPTEAVQAVPSNTLETSRTKEVGNRKKIRAKRAKGCDSFETFWTTYQSIPSDKKAKGQSKAKALDVWSQLVPDEVSAEELQTAVQRLADAAIEADADGEFFTSQPDCFRWLRDDSYSSWLGQNESNDNYKPSYSFL